MGLTCPFQEFHFCGFAIVDQKEMDRNHLIIMCTLHDKGNVIISHALIESGTTGYAFIDEDYAHHHHLPLHLLKSPRNLTIINERPVTSRAITHITHTHLAIWNHQEDIPLLLSS
jgi:hypothetical protein